MYNRGENYVTAPVISAQANSRIRSLGILGKMKIVDGGQNYVIGDTIEFINNYGSYGFQRLKGRFSAPKNSWNTLGNLGR